MNLPTITGVIRRRLLLNYRVIPAVVERLLPENFRPKPVDGYAIAGVCLIRLEQVRPKGLPAFAGISSENSAHRIAVEWEDSSGTTRGGVFVPRRDTGSRLNALAGGRIFPGVHHHAEFTVSDKEGRISMAVQPDGMTGPLLELEAGETDTLPTGSVFGSLAASSEFFEAGCTGYSTRPGSCVMDGLRLGISSWRAAPLAVRTVRSAYYDDTALFPVDSITIDHALIMRNIPHEWHAEPEMIARQKIKVPLEMEREQNRQPMSDSP